MTLSYQSTQEQPCQESLFRLERRIIGGCVVLLLALIVLGSAGCSKIRNENSAAGTGGGGPTSSSPDNSNPGPPSPPVPPSSAAEGTPTTCEANATSLKGTDGQTFTLGVFAGRHSVFGLG